MNPVQHILIFAVRVYRWTLSPVLGALFGPMAGCRFTPTCSAYALEALQTHGALGGSWLATRRLCRCHPWGGCGHDPVPMRGARAVPARRSSADVVAREFAKTTTLAARCDRGPVALR